MNCENMNKMEIEKLGEEAGLQEAVIKINELIDIENAKREAELCRLKAELESLKIEAAQNQRAFEIIGTVLPENCVNWRRTI